MLFPAAAQIDIPRLMGCIRGSGRILLTMYSMQPALPALAVLAEMDLLTRLGSCARSCARPAGSAGQIDEGAAVILALRMPLPEDLALT